jgi:hypothetical protein
MVGLAAMRELANTSARTAVDRHARRMLQGTQRSKLIVAVIAAGVAGLLFYLWFVHIPTPLTLSAGAVAALIAVLWGIQYAIVTGRLVVSKSGHVDMHRGNQPMPGANDAVSTDESNGAVSTDESNGATSPAALDEQPVDAMVLPSADEGAPDEQMASEPDDANNRPAEAGPITPPPGDDVKGGE